jgi:hypothetical protein
METEHATPRQGRADQAASPQPGELSPLITGAPSGIAKTQLALQRTVGNREVTVLVQRLREQIALQRRSRTPGTAARPWQVEMHFSVDNTPRMMHPHHLFQAATQLGRAGDEAGRTDVQAEYVPEIDANGRVIRVTITVPVTVTLPEWPEASNLPPAARVEWERFLRALTDHEQGHVARIRQHLEHFGATPLHVSAEVAEQRRQANLQAMHQATQEYDAQADHGRNNAAIIETNVDGATVDVGVVHAGAAPNRPDAGAVPR